MGALLEGLGCSNKEDQARQQVHGIKWWIVHAFISWWLDWLTCARLSPLGRPKKQTKTKIWPPILPYTPPHAQGLNIKKEEEEKKRKMEEEEEGEKALHHHGKSDFELFFNFDGTFFIHWAPFWCKNNFYAWYYKSRYVFWDIWYLWTWFHGRKKLLKLISNFYSLGFNPVITFVCSFWGSQWHF